MDQPIRLLLCNSEADDRRLTRVVEQLAGTTVELATDMEQALQHLAGSCFDAALVAQPFAGWETPDLLEELQRVDPAVPVILHDPEVTIDGAIGWARLGAWHCLDRTPDVAVLADLVERAASLTRSRRGGLPPGAETEPWNRTLVGESRAMEQVREVIRLVAARRCTVMISGETGTGKEVVARALHLASPRGERPMVSINCTALPENLLEAELFGHVKGAFTGAITNRIGRFEQAHLSTVFLDEIGDMPLDLQAKLLRFLQEREFQRLGSSETVKVDVRVIVATNVDLVARVREGRFREDLYYRLNVVPLTLPPLRERKRDIPPLVEHFIRKICRQEELPPREASPEVLERLCQQDWPGNVRQLENAVEMAVALSGDRRQLVPGDFPRTAAPPRPQAGTAPPLVVPDDGMDFEKTVGCIERTLLEQALRKSGGNKKQAAEMLGLKRTTFSAKLRSLEAVAAV